MGFEIRMPIQNDLRIRFQVALVNEQTYAGLQIPDALWDTGASQTAITLDLAQAIGLPLLREGRTDTAGGITRCWQTCGSILLPDNHLMTIDNLLVLDSKASHVIIGMDIISRHRSTIWREGSDMLLTYD